MPNREPSVSKIGGSFFSLRTMSASGAFAAIRPRRTIPPPGQRKSARFRRRVPPIGGAVPAIVSYAWFRMISPARSVTLFQQEDFAICMHTRAYLRLTLKSA